MSPAPGSTLVPLSPAFDAALALASDLHRGQARKGTTIPYVSHLLAVASIVIEQGADEDVAIAALLHDAVEDQGGPPVLETIRKRFGARVAAIVESCSDAQPLPGQEKAPWKERKDRYLEHLKGADANVRLVSAADKLHNARSILSDLREHGDDLWERFTGKRDGTLWYYRQLVTIFGELGPSRLADELARTVHDIETLARQVPIRGKD